MRSTAVRLSMTIPTGFPIQWPPVCSVCGAGQVEHWVQAPKHAPPLPYCRSCSRVHRLWTQWIQFCLTLGLVLILGPLLFIGAALDRPIAGSDSFHNFSLFYTAVVFFAIILSAIAAGIGYIRRSEIQGVQIHEIQLNDLDDPSVPLSAEKSFVEIRFKNRDFYSATIHANSTANA